MGLAGRYLEYSYAEYSYIVLFAKLFNFTVYQPSLLFYPRALLILS